MQQQLKLVSPDLMVPAPHLGLRLRGGRPAVERTQYTVFELQTKVRESFTITEKAPTRAFFWLKVLNMPKFHVYLPCLGPCLV